MIPRLILSVTVSIFLVSIGTPSIAAPDGGVSEEAPKVAEPIPEDRKPTLKLEVSPVEANIGEVIDWKLTVKHRTSDRVHLSSGASFGSLEVRNKQIVPGEIKGEWTEEVLHVELMGFDPEEIEIPAQKLTLVGEDGRTFEFETGSKTVTVKSLIGNEPEPELKGDAGEGEKVFEKDYTLLWIIGIFLAVGVIVLITLLARWLWAKRAPRPEPPPPPPRPAHEIALEKLKELSRSNLLEDGEVKEFHVRLSEAVREYLGNRYLFDSLELSTEELLDALQKTAIGSEEFKKTVGFLEETDLVKFAKVILTLEESRVHLTKSIDFVHSTTPDEAEESSEKSDG